MSLRSLHKGFVDLPTNDETTQTIPLTFNGCFTVSVNATLSQIGNMKYLTIPSFTGANTAPDLFTSNFTCTLPENCLPINSTQLSITIMTYDLVSTTGIAVINKTNATLIIFKGPNGVPFSIGASNCGLNYSVCLNYV